MEKAENWTHNSHHLPKLSNKTFSIGKTMNVTFTLDDFRMNGTGANTTLPFLTLYDNFGCVRLADADMKFHMNYTYITDPPVLGDWGNFSFSLENTSFTLNSSSIWNDTFDNKRP